MAKEGSEEGLSFALLSSKSFPASRPFTGLEKLRGFIRTLSPQRIVSRVADQGDPEHNLAGWAIRVPILRGCDTYQRAQVNGVAFDEANLRGFPAECDGQL